MEGIPDVNDGKNTERTDEGQRFQSHRSRLAMVRALAIPLVIMGFGSVTPGAEGQNESRGRGALSDNLNTTHFRGKEAIRDEILVGFDAAIPMAERARVRQGLGAQEKRAFARFDCHCWRLPANANIGSVITALQRTPGVRYAEPNYVVYANERIPDDSLFSELWGMRNLGQTGGKAGADIEAAFETKQPEGVKNPHPKDGVSHVEMNGGRTAS